MKTLIDYFAYGCIRGLGMLPLPLIYAIGSLLGRLVWWSKSGSAKVSRINVEMCFSHLSAQERERIARESVYEMATILVESVAAWCKPFDKTFAPRIVKTYGQDLLDNAKQSGRPIVLLSSHFGSYELMLLLTHTLVENTAILFRPIKMKKLGDFVMERRLKNGGQMMPSNREGITAFCNVLKQPGGLVAIAGDLVPSWERGEFSNFMGVPALTANFPTDLIKESNAIVICGHLVRVENNRFHLYFEEVSPDIYSEDKKVAAQAMTDAICKRIAANPEQYAWSYKRFKRMPDKSKPYD